MPPRRAAAAKKQKAVAEVPPSAIEESAPDEVEAPSASTSTPDNDEEATDIARGDEGTSADASSSAGLSREEKLAQLRKRLEESKKANRSDLVAEQNLRRTSAKNEAKLERKRQQLEAMGEKAQAKETGEDLERKRAWEYTIEDNEKWDKKVARKGRRADFSFTDFDDIARRKYKKDLDVFKPDFAAYNKQRQAAEGDVTALVGSSSSGALTAHESLYRDANSFVYADHKPTEDQIDRVIGKINMDVDKRSKRSRERKNEDEGDITYINEKNRMFNKKLARYYDAHTKDIRDNFERGTAL